MSISWTDDPFQDRINPSTKTGQAIYIAKSKGLDEEKRIEVSKLNSEAIMSYLLTNEAQLGKLVTAIPIDRNPDGTSSGKTANLLTQYSKITLDDVERQAHATFQTRLSEADVIPTKSVRTIDPANVEADKETFYDRVDSNIIARLLKNTVTREGYESLLLQKDHFAFPDPASGVVKYDGPTMLKILIDKIEPDNVLGLEIWRRKLATMKLHEHGNDVNKLLDAMVTIHRKITNSGKTHDAYRDNICDALTSGPNSSFNDWVQRTIDDYESGTGANAGITVDTLISAARQKYAMMIDKNTWGKVDPKDAKILALSTRLDEVSKELKSAKNPPASATNAASNTATVDNKQVTMPTPDMRANPHGPEKWRTIKKGEEIEMMGKPWYWCPHHKHKDGHFDGLYCRHKPSEHDAWKERLDKMKGRTNNKAANATNAAPTNSAPSTTTQSKLTLTESLKNVLLTNFGISEDDATKLLDEATSNTDF